MKRDCFEMFFDQIPKGTAQMKRTNRKTGAFFKSKKLQATEDLYMDKLKYFVPSQPLETPIRLELRFFYSTKDRKKDGGPKISRPDCDNVAKLLIDCMTKAGFWVDDAQICDLSIEKRWKRGGAMIVVRYEEVVE